MQLTDDLPELQTKSATPAIGSTRTLQFFFDDDVAKVSQNSPAIIECMVDDVDAEYNKLSDLLRDNLVQEPSTMRWENRSLLFRDPEGHLVNFLRR